MKNIAKTILALLTAIFTLASCVEETADPLSSSISVSSTELILPDSGTVTGTIAVTSDGDWIAVSSGETWFDFSPANGTGNGTISVTGMANTDSFGELNGPRSGVITIIGTDALLPVAIKQKGEPGLDASRTYKKVSDASEIEAGKAYLIVANDGSALQAAKSFNATSDSYYSYIYTDVVADNNGIITRANANNGYTFVAKGSGYAIMQPNGRYLYQAASYNNFYSTTDISKADEWTVTINADGTAKIENATVGGKYFQYSIGYSSYGSYSATQDNSALPVLYKDSAAPSDEVLIVPESTTVAGGETSVTIPVKSNKSWKVRNHDSWINSFTKEGSGDGSIIITFSTNESYEEARKALFTIIGETTNFTVTLTQDHLYNVIEVNVADFNAAEKSDQLYRITGVITKVANANYGNYYLTDWSGTTYVYGTGNKGDFVDMGLKEGDIVTVVGKRDEYKGTIEMTGSTVENIVSVTDCSIEEFLTKEDNNDVYYKVTGTVKSVANSTYGNLYITDGINELYVYGCYPGYGASGDNRKNFLAAAGIEAGDELTMIGYKDTYKGTIELCGGIYFSHKKAE